MSLRTMDPVRRSRVAPNDARYWRITQCPAVTAENRAPALRMEDVAPFLPGLDDSDDVIEPFW